MSQPITLSLLFPLQLFELEELQQARQLAHFSDSELYSWKTSQESNWLERGVSVSDLFGIVVLPRGLPEQIDLPDDPQEPE